MRVELFGFGDDPAVEGMRLFAHHLHYDGLVHAAGNHLADHFLAPSRRRLHWRSGL